VYKLHLNFKEFFYLIFVKNILFDIFSHEKKLLLFSTGPQDNRNKGKKKNYFKKFPKKVTIKFTDPDPDPNSDQILR
jgi:hypothetical protein